MRIGLVYVFPIAKFQLYEPMARRFIAAYRKYSTAAESDLYVCINGSDHATQRQTDLFLEVSPKFIFHDNSAKDIGAYRLAASILSCDLLVCLGTPVRPCVEGWLDYMVAAFERHGPGIYGCWGYHVPSRHLRTTCFWLPPAVLNAYPHRITTGERYEFEFGNRSLSAFGLSMGLPLIQVTLAGTFPVEQFHHVEREESIMLDQHCDRLGYQ